MNKILILFISCLAWGTSHAQKSQPAKDSTVTFRVAGVCEQCKDRIEAAAKTKGVRTAIWDESTQLLQLTFDPAKTTVDKVQRRIVAVGHDIGPMIAKTSVYEALPACCHYRDPDNEHNNVAIADGSLHEMVAGSEISTTIDKHSSPDSLAVTGLVLEMDKKGKFIPLTGATVLWLHSGKGTATNETGMFSIRRHQGDTQLVISYTGYLSDTLTVTDTRNLKVVLASGKQLNEVVITARQRASFLATNSPVRMMVMTEKELFKAACCNLSESFETNPSVDVSYNDAVTGSKQIQLLGLSGNYTQLTVENLPGPRGLATALGLNSIAGPWIESIQLSKGTGSVVNGYESIAGQINVELKKPEKAEQLYANVYVNDFGKTDLNLNLSKQLGSRWSTALLLHDDFINNATVDFNKDDFRDLPTGNQFNLVNRWKYEDGKGFIAQFGWKLLTDKKVGGEVDFIESRDKNTNSNYGLGINTSRYEAFAKIGYVFPEKKYQSIGLQLSAIQHKQDAYFGLINYNGQQVNFYSNLIYQSIINNTNHKFRTGLSFLVDNYNELYQTNRYTRKELVPGAFFEYTYDYLKKLSIVAGLRADYNSLFGFFLTPRINIKYEPVKGTVLHFNAGRGQRTANIFAENNSVLVSARDVRIIGGTAGKAYGLNPEVAWNKGISIDQQLKLFNRNAMLSIDFYRTDFTNQVITEMEDIRSVRFYNLQGKSYSNSLQAELSFEPVDKLDIRMAYRYYDVKATFDGKLLERPLIAAHRAFANIAYGVAGWKFDYTISYNGSKRIPGTMGNPAMYQRSTRSPAFVMMNAQVTKTISKKHGADVYLGVENLGNYFQRDVIIAADQPFGQYFDASLVWGPVSGRMLYAGFRFKIK